MKKFCLKSLSFLTKTFLVLLILVMLSVGGFAIRLAQGPISLDFAKEYVQDALRDKEAGYAVTMGELLLEWSSVQNAIFLTMEKVSFSQSNKGQAPDPFDDLNVEKAMIGISAPHLLTGQVLPTELVIEEPIIRVVKRDGVYDLFWRRGDEGNKKPVYGPQRPTPEEIHRDVAYYLDQIAEPTTETFGRFAALREITLSRAIIKQEVISTSAPVDEGNADVLSDSGDGEGYIALADITLKRNEAGLEGDLDIQLPGAEGQKAGLKAALFYRKEQKDLTLDGRITDINPSELKDFIPGDTLLTQQDLLLNGDLKAALNSDMQIQNAALKINIDEGALSIPEEYEEPISIKDVNFDFSVQRGEEKVSINNFSAIIQDIPVSAKAEGSVQKGNIYFPVTVTMPEVTFEKLATLMPKSMDESSASDWIKNKLKDGIVRDLVLTKDVNVLRDAETKERSVTVTNARAEFGFEDLSVHYSSTLMPVKKARGKGIYENDSLTIESDAGNIGDVKSTNVKLTMTDLSVEGGGMADIQVKGNGPLKSILTYIADEPIALNEEEIGIDAASVEGNVDFDLSLKFPTVKDLPKEEVNVVIDGRLTNTKLPKIVQDLDLEGGPYNLKFEKGKITLAGKGTLSGREIDLNYQQFLDPAGKEFETKVEADIVADQFLRDAFGVTLDDYVSGNVPIQVVYKDKPNGSALIDVKGAMSPAVVHIEPFLYRKDTGVAGDFSLKVLVKYDDVVEINNFNLKTRGLSFEGGRIIFRTLQNGETEIARGSITKATLGKTVAKIDFEVTPDNVLKVVADGPTIDLNPFLNQEKKKAPENSWVNPDEEGGQAMKVSFKANRVLTVVDNFIRNAQFYLETDNETDITQLEIDANVGEKGTFYVRFKPEADGKRTFRMESTDAGATLKAFDLYEDMKGGKIIIYGRPQSGDNKGNLFGSARFEDFTVVDAPALARLLGALSLSGAEDALKTNGISFSKLESEFEWRFRDDGNLLVVKEGRTSGSSLGLTFEGVTDMGEETIDISGTVIPLSGVNKVIGDIPLIGDILTGGSKGGLFAATYTMSGPSSDPKVVINPLSVLTPGIFRKILFEGGYESKLPENQPANRNIPPAQKRTVNE